MENEFDSKVLIKKGNISMISISVFYVICVIIYGFADIELPGYLAFFAAVIVGIICISYIQSVMKHMEQNISRMEKTISNN